MTKHKHLHPETQPQSDVKNAESTSQAEVRPQASDAKSQAAAPNAAEVEITKIREELNAAKDRALRAHAELDNYRKRASRELADRTRYAELDVLRDILPVLDNVDRAIEAAEKSTDALALLDGFKMVHQQLNDLLKAHHCEPIEALHQPFDPNVHHAVMQQPSEEHPANTVLMVTQSGYQLHDRVVRPSQVIVSKVKES